MRRQTLLQRKVKEGPLQLIVGKRVDYQERMKGTVKEESEGVHKGESQFEKGRVRLIATVPRVEG